jgi:hypothetical protein
MLSRRSFLLKSTAAASAALIEKSSFGRTFPLTGALPLAGKKVLFIWGGWMGHEPDKCRDIFVPWLKSEGAIVTVSDTLDSYVQIDLKNGIDLIIQAWTMGQLRVNRKRPFLKPYLPEPVWPDGTEDLEILSETIPSTSSW